MTHERDQTHATASHDAPHEREEVVPGRSSRSALMRKPDHAIASGLVQRKARDANGVAEGADHAVAAASSSSGSALPATLMRKFESSLGADLSGVRVHTGESSAAANDAVGARAYTMGNDIHFGAGQYDPHTPAGEHLLAHEVAHTVQQSGGAQRMQFKLAVSSPGDALEHEADTASIAMVAGQRATVSAAVAGVSRLVFRDAVDTGYGGLAGAGDAAESDAAKKSLSVDSMSLTKDMSDVSDTVGDIKKHQNVLEKVSETDVPRKQEYVATNTEAVTKLAIFNDKLSVSTVDTSAFVAQYRVANTDFQRLNAEAHELTTNMGVNTADAIGDVTAGAGAVSGLKLDLSTELSEFKGARQNLNTAAKKMTGKLATARGAANGLQAALYNVQAAAAAAKAQADQDKIAGIKAEIAEVAGGVSKVVKLVSAVAGFAGGGSATGAALGAVKEPTSATIEAADIPADLKGTSLGAVLEKKQQLDLDPVGSAKKDIVKGMYGDAGKLNVSDQSTVGAILSGDPAKLAEALVTALGESVNKSKLEKLQTDITEKAKEVEVLKDAAAKLDLASKYDTLKGAADELSTEVEAFQFAKKDVADKRDTLMAKLAKGGGKKGSDQAKLVLFLSDSDRFLAQVRNTIAVGVNQQENMKQAADDRKNLRGTDAPFDEDGIDRSTQHYFRCVSIGKKPWYESGTNYYQITRMDVKFTQHDNMMDPNITNQGGAGTVEGVGGAADTVAQKLKVLQDAQTKVQKLQKACQDALFGAGKGDAGVNG